MSSALGRGRSALADADWVTAKLAFEEALATGSGAEARDGLGYALWWLGDVEGAVREREIAYIAYVDGGNRQGAARLALFISNEHAHSYGNAAAAKGWEARAERLLADVEPCAEMEKADLAPIAVADVDCPFEFPDLAQALRALLAAGPVVLAIRTSGKEKVEDAVTQAIAPYRTNAGGYRLENKFRYLVAERR